VDVVASRAKSEENARCEMSSRKKRGGIVLHALFQNNVGQGKYFVFGSKLF
jgi:hypothetical protein